MESYRSHNPSHNLSQMGLPLVPGPWPPAPCSLPLAPGPWPLAPLPSAPCPLPLAARPLPRVPCPLALCCSLSLSVALCGSEANAGMYVEIAAAWGRTECLFRIGADRSVVGEMKLWGSYAGMHYEMYTDRLQNDTPLDTSAIMYLS